MEIFTDEYFMKEALKEAQMAFDKDEVPIGAVVVVNKKIIGRGHNLTEQLKDVTAHAEMQAITAASNHLGGKYLTDCTLYVTLEPCVMCAGALKWAQMTKIVFGAEDTKYGASRSGINLYHPQTEVIGGVLGAPAAALLKTFFQRKRE